MIRVLGRGCKGPDVTEVQKALNRRDRAGLKPDSDFGGLTEAAVVRFQSRYQLKPDGRVGSATRSVLFPLAGITIHVVGAYAMDDIPVLSMDRRARGGNSLRGPLLAQAGGAFPVGDPSPDPLPPPIPDILKHLPALRDPSSGPTNDFKLSDGQLLPIPPVLTAPLLLVPGMRVTSQQLQIGGSFNTRPLLQNPSGSPNPSGGFVLAFQSVLTRNKDQPGRIEIAEGLQLGKPMFAKTKDGTNWSLQWFVQATWADPFWQRGRFHLVQPFVQLGAQRDLQQGGTTLSAGLFPVNINVDVVRDKVSIFGQGGIVGSWDLGSGRVELGQQAIIGASVTFGAF